MRKALLLGALAGFAVAVTAVWFAAFYQASALGYRLARARSVTAAVDAARDLVALQRPDADQAVQTYVRRNRLAVFDRVHRYLLVHDPGDGVCYQVRRRGLPARVGPRDARMLAALNAQMPLELVPVRIGEPPARYAEVRILESTATDLWCILRPRNRAQGYGVVHVRYAQGMIADEQAYRPAAEALKQLQARSAWPRSWR